MKLLAKPMTQIEAIETCKRKGWRLPTPTEAESFILEHPECRNIFWTSRRNVENHNGIEISLGTIMSPNGLSQANSLFKFRVRVIK